MAAKSKVKDFQNDWCMKYGIKVSARDFQTGFVISTSVYFVKNLLKTLI
jgi:hypothetical protein